MTEVKIKLVKLGLRTCDGNMVYLAMTSTALLDLMSMGTKLLNTHTAQFMADAARPV